VSEQLVAFQKKQRQAVIDAINAAQNQIEQEIEKFGYYPEPDHELNVKELCRRAKIGYSTLKNKTHDGTRQAAKNWLQRMKLKLNSTRRSRTIDPTKPHSVALSLTALARELDLFKLKFEAIKEERDALRDERDTLKAENKSLQAEIARHKAGAKKVVEFPGTNNRK
jgi:cell division protein FtsB